MMNIERVDPVVLIRQSPDVDRVKGDRERRRREDDEQEDREKREQGEETPAQPPAADSEQSESDTAADQKRPPVVVYEPSADTGVRKHEADRDSTIDYKG